MKTAISLPDPIFERAERAAKELGMTRSELYARAVDAFVRQTEQSSLTQRLDAAIDRSGVDADTTADTVTAGRRRVTESGEW